MEIFINEFKSNSQNSYQSQITILFDAAAGKQWNWKGCRSLTAPNWPIIASMKWRRIDEENLVIRWEIISTHLKFSFVSMLIIILVIINRIFILRLFDCRFYLLHQNCRKLIKSKKYIIILKAFWILQHQRNRNHVDYPSVKKEILNWLVLILKIDENRQSPRRSSLRFSYKLFNLVI